MSDFGDSLGDLFDRLGDAVTETTEDIREFGENIRELGEDFREDPLGTATSLVSSAREEVSTYAVDQWNAAWEQRRIAREYRDSLIVRIAALESLYSFLTQYEDNHYNVALDLSNEPANQSGDYLECGSGAYMQEIYNDFTEYYDTNYLLALVQAYINDIESLKERVNSALWTMREDKRAYDAMKWLTPFGWLLI